MLIDTTLLLNSPEIIQGLLDGSMTRYGSVIRYSKCTEKAGQIISHLAETPGLTNKLINAGFSPTLGGVDVISQGLNYHKLMGIEKSLSSVMGLTQIAAGASVLNLGASIAGFAYMGYKLHQMQNSLNNLQQFVEKEFAIVKERLDIISGQLAYLYLLVEDNRQKQQNLAKAISHIQQAMIIKEIASLNAGIKRQKTISQRITKRMFKSC